MQSNFCSFSQSIKGIKLLLEGLCSENDNNMSSEMMTKTFWSLLVSILLTLKQTYTIILIKRHELSIFKVTLKSFSYYLNTENWVFIIKDLFRICEK